MDPRCNACVSRVCEVDPTCCGDPGDTFYPRALAWDDRCIALRSQVCRSTPGAAVWPPGQAAPVAGQTPPVFLRGAIGSFEAVVTEAGGTFVEGWACDPDFPGAASPIQISVGGALGATGATLYTASADQPLATGWRDVVAAECGGAGRHGFRFALPTGSAGKDVFVYGIDLNVPGAPFSLLRGGKKTVPSAAALVNPRAAIWTGWIEPAASASYTFCKRQAGTTATCTPVPAPINPAGEDRYRIWVNGVYVAGNWVDADATVPGAFTLPPPSTSPAQFLQKGVRYPVRVEYLRPDTLPDASEISLLWSAGGAAPAPIPTASLYPMAQVNGNGLQGTFFPDVFSLDSLPANSASPFSPTFGAPDRLWTDVAPPVPGLSVEQSFGARFEGQVVPPISGDYLFTADTDGLVRITVNGRVVTDTTGGPPSLDPGTCAHDICGTGGALSRTCQQGSFCAGLICRTDPTCCSITWDARCVEEVKSVCGIGCSPTPPVAITLNAGWRYDVKVEYVHAGGASDRPARAAKLRLMWALAGAPRAAIPAERFFAATSAPAPARGTGLNAAYFSDPAFTDEYLDHVEAALDFRGATRPAAARAVGIVCPGAGSTVCASADVLGAPGFSGARMVAAAGAGAVTVELKGGGAARGATVTLLENGAALATVLAKSDATDGGTFVANVILTRGPHTLIATQTIGGVTSAPSAPLAFEVTDPAAPAPPQVSQPAAGTLYGTGQVAVSGTAAPNATVTVTAKPGGTGAAVVATVVANASGAWSGTLTLPPGSYDVTTTQTVGGATSVGATAVHVDVALPPLAVTAPADGAVVTCAPNANRTCAVTVSGTGAAAGLGAVIAGDGDGQFFVDLSPTLGNTGGAFSGTLALDYGTHVLKIFQRANGLDGAGVLRRVTVQPPVGALAIVYPLAGAATLPTLVVTGTGGLPRTGLPGTAVVYQGATRLAEGLSPTTARSASPSRSPARACRRCRSARPPARSRVGAPPRAPRSRSPCAFCRPPR